jgi:ribosomal protein L11 methyltransferase
MDFSNDGAPSLDVDFLNSDEVDETLDIEANRLTTNNQRPSDIGEIRTVNIDIGSDSKLVVHSGAFDESGQRTIEAPSSGDVCIYLPKVIGAWGSGQHPTTKLSCMQLADMRQYVRNTDVLDFGCGSGILAILAAKFECRRVVGVDIEPTAVDCSQSNAAFNHAASQCSFYLPPAEFLRNDIDFFCRYGEWSSYSDRLMPIDGQEFGLVVANILPGPLVRLAPLLCRLCRPGGVVCLAGMRRFQAEQLRAAYAACGVELAAASSLRDESGEEWIAMRGTRAPPLAAAP